MMDGKLTSQPDSAQQASGGCGLDRRDFLGAGVAAVATALTGCGTLSKEEFLQHNFQELSKEEVLSVIARLEKEYKAKYGRDVKVGTTPAMPGVIFGYALDLSRCIGCRRCVHACVKENNQSRSPEVQWIRVLELDKDVVSLEEVFMAYYTKDGERRTTTPTRCPARATSTCRSSASSARSRPV